MFYYYGQVIRKYIVFSGRTQRAEYWYFTLVNLLVGILISVLSWIVNLALFGFPVVDGMVNQTVAYSVVSTIFRWLVFGYLLFIFIPGIAVTVRRLHDIGKSGWMIFVLLIPLIGPIWMIILMATDSEPGENEYGPNPKGVTSSAEAVHQNVETQASEVSDSESHPTDDAQE